MGVSSPIVARGPAHPIAQAARVAVFSRSHGATHVKRVPGVVSHFVHELAPPSHEHSESLPEGQALLQAPPPDGDGAPTSLTLYPVLHWSEYTSLPSLGEPSVPPIQNPGCLSNLSVPLEKLG